MRFQNYPIAVPVDNTGSPTTGPGNVTSVSGLREKYLQVAGLTGGPVNLEGSLDGTHWTVIQATLVNGFLAVPHTVQSVRLNAGTAVSAGTFVIGGNDSRTA